MKPNKELGQNFLVDEDIVEELVGAGEVTKEDVVLEIGSGLGFVTKKLAEAAGEVVAVEIDSNLIHILQNNLGTINNVTLINDDALSVLKDLTKIYPKINKTVSSIPFQITSPLLHELVTLKDQLKLSALLIQKEVAERICAKTPD